MLEIGPLHNTAFATHRSRYVQVLVLQKIYWDFFSRALSGLKCVGLACQLDGD